MSRSRTLRRTSVLCAVVALASVFVMHLALSSRARAACTTSEPDAVSAMSTASSCGTSVEDLSQRTDTTQVYANSDGTWNVSVAAQPASVRRSDGSWVATDLTLGSNSDGSLSPAASPVTTTLSGGGAGGLLTLTTDGRSLSLGWPAVLPAPVVSGTQATYSEVLPGVDLVVRATPAGADEVLVVKSREAAANPSLAHLSLPVSAPGLTLTVSDAGLLAADDSGAPVLAMGPPVMWDSTVSGVTGATADDPAGGEPATSDASGPGAVAQQAPMAVQLSGGSLVVSPDTTMLTASTTQFPVYLDPSVSVARTSWTMINSRFPSQEYWDYDRKEHAKVGWTNKDNKGNTVPSMVYRSLFQFSTSGFRGRHIISAAMTDYLVHSWSCANSVTELHQSSQTLGSGTTWNSNASSWGASLATVNDNNCHDASGVQPQWTSQALTNAVVSVAGGSASSVTFGLKAGDESSTAGWKKFDENNAKLNVTYNSYPNTPASLTIDGRACGTGTGKAYVSTLGGHNPVLKARLSDPDAADHLTGTFTWTTSGGSATASQANIANGQYAQVTTTGGAFTAGTTYSYIVSASDGRDSSKVSGGPCEFVVDGTAPNTRPTVASADGRYPDDGGTSGWHDGVGRTGTFTLGPNGASDSGVDDVVAYLYGLGVSPPVTSVAAAAMGGTATVSVTPSRPGLNDLYVRSVDRAGNVGPVTDYRFFVASGSPAVDHWALSEGSGTTAADTGTGKHQLTLAGGAGWSPGRMIGTSAAGFNGTGAYATTGTPVVTTASSFSVAAWVRPTNTSGWGSVLGQQGTHVSGALLQRTPQGAWAFTAHTADANDPVSVRATSPTPAVTGVWTHLVGVYDAGAKQIRLYVNGALSATANVTVSWNATGPFIVGREWFDGGYMSYFSGDIADVQVWDRAIGADDAAAWAAPSLAAQWDLDEGQGTTAHDATGRHDLTVPLAPPQSPIGDPVPTPLNAARWETPGHNPIVTGDQGALRFTFPNKANVDTTGPVVRTDQSFTVTAWVNRVAMVPPGSRNRTTW